MKFAAETKNLPSDTFPTLDKINEVCFNNIVKTKLAITLAASLLLVMALAVMPAHAQAPRILFDEIAVPDPMQQDANLIKEAGMVDTAKEAMINETWGSLVAEDKFGNYYYCRYDGNYVQKDGIRFCLDGSCGEPMDLPTSVGEKVLLVNLTSGEYGVCEYETFATLKEYYEQNPCA